MAMMNEMEYRTIGSALAGGYRAAVYCRLSKDDDQMCIRDRVMYCRMLDAMLSNGQEDENGILFVCFPVTAIAAVLSRSSMTVKRSLNELENAGLIMRVRQGVGEPNRIYVLIPGKEDAALA